MNSYKKPQSKDEKHRGTVFFIFGLLIAIFFGGGVRTLLSPQQVESFINKELEQRKPKFDVVFTEARLTLSRGWVPRLGLQLTDLKLISNNVCLNPVNLVVDDVYIPVNIFRFLRGGLQFLHIELGDIEISALDKPANCGQTNAEETIPARDDGIVKTVPKKTVKELEAGTSFDHFMERFNSFINTRWAIELENTRKWMTGISANRIRLRLAEGQVHEINDFYVSAGRSGDFSRASFIYTPDEEVVYYQPLQNIKFALEVNEDLLRIEGGAAYKEGQWDFSGELLLESNQFQFESGLKTVPVAEVFHGFSKTGILPNIKGSRPIWLSCEKKFKGSLLHWRDSSLELSKCLISGELGSIQLSKSQVYPFKRPISYQPFKVRLTRFSLENLLDAFNKKPPFDIFHQLGFVSGEISFSKINDIQFMGSVEDAVLVFRLNGKRAFQKLEQASGELLFREGRFSGQITDVKIPDGVFEGQVSLNLDKRFRDGIVQANVSRLNFNSDVLELLQLQGVRHFEAYGQGEINNGNVVSWKGSVGFPQMQDEGLTLEKAKFRSQWEGQKWSGRLTTRRVRIEKGHPLFQIMMPLYLEENKYSDHLNLRDLETELAIDSQTFRWMKARGWDLDKDIVFATEGQFSRDESLQGEIVVDFPVLKLLRWKIDGTFSSPKIHPSVKMLKELAKKKPEMTTPTSIEFVPEKFYLPKAFQGSPAASLKKIKNKVLDSAKKILPKSENPE